MGNFQSAWNGCRDMPAACPAGTESKTWKLSASVCWPCRYEGHAVGMSLQQIEETHRSPRSLVTRPLILFPEKKYSDITFNPPEWL